MSNPQKDLRKQLKNLVQEVLPEVLAKELEGVLYKKLSDEIMARISIIEKAVATTLKEVNDRSKTVTSYLMTQTELPKAGIENEKK